LRRSKAWARGEKGSLWRYPVTFRTRTSLGLSHLPHTFVGKTRQSMGSNYFVDRSFDDNLPEVYTQSCCASGRRIQRKCPLQRRPPTASQIAFVVILTALGDEIRRTPRIRFATHRNLHGSVRPVRARLERISIAIRCWIAHALARENGQSRSRGHIERLISLEGLLTAGA
jgi:hypothetical protein